MIFEEKDLGIYKLHFKKEEKFKYTDVCLKFRKKIEKKDLIYLRLLKSLLTKSSFEYKTTRLLNIKKEDLYNPEIFIASYRKGNIINFEFWISILDDKYTQKNNFNESINFGMSILFNPDIENNCWNNKYFDIEKNRVIDEINSIKENPRLYSDIQAFKAFDKDGIVSYNIYDLEELNNITSTSLYEYYINFINNSLLDIYVCGNNDINNLITLFKKHIKNKILKKNDLNPYLEYSKIRNKILIAKEKSNYKESRLIIINKTNKLTEFEEKYVTPIYNYILGGGTNSLLFDNIREKYNLCYSIFSSFNSYDHLLVINSSIDSKNFLKVKKSIEDNILNMRKGNFSKNQLNNFIELFKTNIQSIEDSIENIIYYMQSYEYNSDNLETKLEHFKKVTKKDIIKVSKKIDIDTIYLLEGDSNGM